MSEPLSVVVVAGGKSARLGEDKRALRLWGPEGPTLLEHTLDTVGQFSDDIIAVLNDPEAWGHLSARIVSDTFPGSGVLGGIYSGLVAAKYEHALVVAGDMPLLNPALIGWMIAQPRTYDVLVPRLGDGRARNKLGVESLHAIYRRSCSEPIRRQLETGNPQIIGFFPQVSVEYVEPATIASFDPDGVAFKNVNTPDDLAAVHRFVRGDGHV